MFLSPPPENKSTLLLAEVGLTAIAIAISLVLPRLGSTWFNRIEHFFLRLARKPLLAVATVGFSALLLRAAILPLFPAPLPSVPNDFSFLLAADTFAHGRLANPMPAMWTHFESIDITVRPTYMSMFFPGWGLALGAAQFLFGHPWIANLFAGALMCAAICWMLQAWLPPSWALLGGFLALLRIDLFTYWINTIAGGNGLLDAFSGALVLGALPRLTRTARLRYGLLLALGIGMLALTRPYEGLLLSFPVAVYLARWIWKGKNRPAPVILLRRAAFPLALLFAALAWLGYYNSRAFGSPTTLPYTLARQQYGVASNFAFLPPRPEPQYRHAMLREYYAHNEFIHYEAIHSLSGYLPSVIGKIEFAAIFLSGFALLPPFIMFRRVLLDRRVRFLLVCASMALVGMMTESFFIPHYIAPFTAAIYALGLQALRHLRVWSPNRPIAGRTPSGIPPAGTTMVRLIVSVCVVLAAAQILSASPRSSFDPARPGSARAKIQAHLENLPGRQLVFVRYLPTHDPTDDWIYNRAALDHSKVIWAWDMGTADNLELMRYYPDRKAWLAEPDASPVTLVPYTVPAPALAGSTKLSASGS